MGYVNITHAPDSKRLFLSFQLVGSSLIDRSKSIINDYSTQCFTALAQIAMAVSIALLGSSHS
jgi:hypothetical protein